ncbi:MAG: YeeE/YedE thiosulfate transporter family protein [Halioglobus sp.]
MTELSALIWTVLLLLALLMGFVADRTNLCTVSAVAEIMIERRATVLWNIVKIVFWILGITTVIHFFFKVTPFNNDRFTLSWISIGGGLIFGAGAALNGGCSLQIITRLGRGNLGTIFSILGMPAGAALARIVLIQFPNTMPLREAQPLSLSSNFQLTLVIVLGLAMLAESIRLMRGFKPRQWRARLLAPDYQPATSAALLGIANGTLFSLVGTWMFTYTLIQSLTNAFYPDSVIYRPIPIQLWWLLAAYLLGITVSAIQSRHALLQTTPKPMWIRYFFGGVLMGLGAALVPGGNDMLLFNGIPGLSLHALPAYMAMLLGIGVSLAVIMKIFPDQELC